MPAIINSVNSIRGQIEIPGDKSITHRAIMVSALAEGDTKISHFHRCADTVSTIACFQKMGISIEDLGNNEILVHGKGLYGLECPNSVLNVGNSGTTTRLLSGILSAQSFSSEMRGDDSLNRRPMEKIITPLRLMGANITSKMNNNSTPLIIEGGKLHGITYHSPIASAQIKSSILLAGLYADSPTVIVEPIISRNHTERILRHFGADIVSDGANVTINPGPLLKAKDLSIPGDLSSAAFLMTAALVLPDSELLVKHVGINETRLGYISAVQQMGGDIQLLNAKDGIEPCADILVKSSKLHGITIERDQIPTAIDEIPILTVLACFAEGTTVIKDAAELKYKESNRIDALTENLSRMGADITATDDGMIISGGNPLHGAIIGSRLDHRIAMSLAIAATLAEGKTELFGSECVSVSYPNFYKDLESISIR